MHKVYKKEKGFIPHHKKWYRFFHTIKNGAGFYPAPRNGGVYPAPRNGAGFTLVELLITMTIVAVLAALALVSYQGARRSARDGKRKADLEEIRSALEMCYADTGVYPPLTFGGSLTCGGNTYMGSVPVDPINSAPYIYTYNTTGTTHTLCANRLETTGSNYCVTNP